MSLRLRVEFHCHTIYSKDSLTKPEKLVDTCRKRGIDRAVVTDHNTIAGALKAREIDPERVIVGEEIMTQQGELLAAYVQDEVPAGLDAFKTIEILRDQKAFISVSHPFDRLRSGHWQPEVLQEIAPLVDAIEVFNARCFPSSFNKEAQDFAHLENIPGTVGSDAHAPFELGMATMLLPEFNDAESLLAAIRQAQFDVSYSGPWVRLASRWAVFMKQLNPSLIPV
ncbi:MAG: PHP domain-containing protein [Chloroflexi bacterium]|nr:MAG: PHP domain-containing protein [Chloroflexota bacterium]MBL1194218.1 PHP domain-containing protein [Chloroflexota bacterium]NOH11511.1 PHP domain-containing protein [Chloroflexota bacterium]